MGRFVNKDSVRLFGAVVCLIVAAQSFLAASDSRQRLAAMKRPDFHGFRTGPYRFDLAEFDSDQRRFMEEFMKSRLEADIQRLDYEQRIQTFRAAAALTGAALCFIGHRALNSLFPD